MVKFRVTKCVFVMAVLVISVFCAASLIKPAQAASTVIFDDQGVNYWSPYNGGGQGTLAISLTNDTGSVYSGSSSLKATISAGNNSVVGFYHYFSQSVDWSSYSSISFWLQGSQSGNLFSFAVLDSNNNHILNMIPDNFTGWRFFSFNLQNGSSGQLDLSNISMIEFAFSAPAPTQLCVDYMALSGSSNATATSSPATTPATSPSASPANFGSAPTSASSSVTSSASTPVSTSIFYPLSTSTPPSTVNLSSSTNPVLQIALLIVVMVVIMFVANISLRHKRKSQTIAN